MSRMSMDPDYPDVDPSDTVDTDAQDWADDRTRLLTDGRTVTPNTLDDEMAAIRKSRRAEHAKHGDIIHARHVWTVGDRWGEAS